MKTEYSIGAVYKACTVTSVKEREQTDGCAYFTHFLTFPFFLQRHCFEKWIFNTEKKSKPFTILYHRSKTRRQSKCCRKMSRKKLP